ncbi:flagellar FlbD family protein [Oceanobacillus caeni]|uniref:Flagellar protein FlbD n=2 Tax=Bacillales TaxID=1385 RepID=A0ABR5MLK2_9BACI|nr:MULTISPECIES: flagellar FlbD family protein [Bacillaceae]KKE78458.1 flagellar protein FlbD [Bacilli bacterium VT-13-104]PZD88736.1 flagellar protein FlbD [Bacilli bacterium]KPH77046.1 flagellar protein FlbD [Oceanobacillus caeni]MBU8790086.1 flagellar FlbD family protein [Oceanobacillus caeni]MCR1833245.1 flagellar FlbD family protein [Oceanobacillus caeni]
MIELIRLNGDSFNLNAMLIEQVESLPDSTTITLINGKKLVVKNNKTDIVQKVTSFYQTIGFQFPAKTGDRNE